MTSSGSNREQTCAVCGAKVATDAPFCWLCREAIERLEADAAAAAPPPVIVEPRAPLQFGLSTLFLMMTLCAVMLGVFSISPGLGGALAVLSVPPVIRTCLVVYRLDAEGRNVTPSEKIALYVMSLFVMMVILTGLALVLAAVWYATFSVACIVEWTNSGSARDAKNTAWFAVLITAVVLAWPTVLWIRQSWRKDVQVKGENKVTNEPEEVVPQEDEE